MSSTKPTRFDLVLEDGIVIDGTGSARFVTDVGIVGDRIAALGDLAQASAAQRLNVSERVVAPGFIDVHTHDDRALLSSPDMTPKVSQGVTTVVAGNCGISLSPLQGVDPPPPLNLLGDAKWYTFATPEHFMTRLRECPAAVNAAFLVGHSTLRVGAMDDLNRAASATEIARMGEQIEACMQVGFIGLSVGLGYPPAQAAPTSELISLARRLPEHAGIFTAHMRNESDDVLAAIDETLTVGKDADVPIVISHFKVSGKKNWGRSKQTLAAVAAAREHQRVDFDAYPYVASSTVLSFEHSEEAERVTIAWSDPHPQMAGKDLCEIANEWGCTQEEAVAALQPAGAIYYSMCEEDLQRILKFPCVMIGSDGLPHDSHPHPRLWGTFPRVLGHYSLELQLFGLEDAVHRMTGRPAAVFGFKDRGEVRVGAYADLVIFDPDCVCDSASFDEPKQSAAGIMHVFVNGIAVRLEGADTGARPGRSIRREPRAPA